MIRILDYGINNISSVAKAVRFLGYEPSIGADLADAERLIIPGVGAFGRAMAHLEPLRPEIRRFAESGRPVLGICLGMQLLFDSSEEYGSHRGLELIPGVVRYLPRDRGFKVPHMGWTTLQFPRPVPLAAGFDPGEQVYFVHSLYCDPLDSQDAIATAEHGIEFTAAVQRGAIWGTQFHPEKSGAVGLRMLQNFLSYQP